ncbi:hypothetical protein GCM10010970_41460 [Silvimonas iriomotensis]|uniref:Uncharacterized protein n=1 Tax=Silvimonas iriomotensis TaxID=449662 RepID=A0ABQ2PFI5_9NEIS|nr:hypothetical protein GCM10010970_41460 [Silvimonas iriomotensis]
MRAAISGSDAVAVTRTVTGCPDACAICSARLLLPERAPPNSNVVVIKYPVFKVRLVQPAAR